MDRLTNRNYNEMYKLVALCALEGIKFDFHRMYDGYQINVGFDDAVIHCLSQGEDLGLLETWKFGNCAGYETADAIFADWQKKYKTHVF